MSNAPSSNPFQAPSGGNKALRSASPGGGESRVAWLIWMAYGAFYFCRTNLSAAVPGMMQSPEEGGLGLTEVQVGQILAGLKIAYAVGQLVNGQFAELISPRRLLAIGMFGSALLNVVFGFSTAVYFLLFIWAANGYCQSLGWPPSVRIVANWVSPHRRGKVMGFIGTGYQVTAVLTLIVAGHAAEYFGWRGALFVPAILLSIAGVVTWLLLEERPSDEAVKEDISNGGTGPAARPKNSLATNILITLNNPALWLLGISLGLLNACRYGFLDWGVKLLVDVHDSGVAASAVKNAVLPAGGILGSYMAGWATDRFFGSRRAPVAFLLLTVLGCLCLVYHWVAVHSVPATVAMLGLIGFCLYGPQVLLVGTAPADMARKGTSAAAAGFVNALGYLGAASGDYFTGHALEASGWENTIYLWAGWAFGAAIASGVLWNVVAKDDSN